MLSRRGLLGMFAAGTAAAIIRTPGLLMPIKALWKSESMFVADFFEEWTFHGVDAYGNGISETVRLRGTSETNSAFRTIANITHAPAF